jgi:hypothetical protein
VGFACGSTPSAARTTCSTGICDGEGNCVQCIDAAEDCASSQVCHDAACVAAAHYWPEGFNLTTGFTAGTEQLAEGKVHAFLLPHVEYRAKLLSLGFVGFAGSSKVAMALYQGITDGSVKRPDGPPLAQWPDTQDWKEGVLTYTVTPNNVELEPGTDYWIAIKNTDSNSVTLRSKTNQESLGWTYTVSGVTFPSISVTGVAKNDVDWNIFTRIQDLE